MTIAEFLLARIEEDEELLRDEDRVYGGGGVVSTNRAFRRASSDIAAKRQTVTHHAPTPAKRHPGFECQWCRLSWPCFDVLNLAPIYADHPDYDQEWKP